MESVAFDFARATGSGRLPGADGDRVDPTSADSVPAQDAPHGAGRLGRVLAGVDRLDDPWPEDHAVEERVGRQTVRPVDAVARDLAGDPETRERGGAVEVGDDATAAVVGRRRDGEPVGGRVQAHLVERRANRGESLVEVFEHRGVEPHVLRAVGLQLRADRPRDDVARLEFVDELLAFGVAQQRTVAAQRLRQERTGHRRVVECRGVELHELHVGDRSVDPQRHGHAVARGLERVGRHRVQLAAATGGEQDVAGPDLDALAVLVDGEDADAAPTVDEQVEGERALEQHRSRLSHGIDQRPFDLHPRGGTARVEDARVTVPALSGEQVLATVVAVEHGAERDQFVDASRTLVDENADGFEVAEAGASVERVRQMEVGRIGVSAEHRGDAALGPAGRRLLQLALGEHADPHAVDVGGPYRGREACDAGAEDEQIERVHAGSLPEVRRVLWPDTCRRPHGRPRRRACRLRRGGTRPRRRSPRA